MKLGKNIHYVHSHSTKNCTKHYKEGKHWKLKKAKTRKRKKFKSALHTICRQIVSFAEALDRGIPVIYVNPEYMSKRCSRCGHFGRRTRKHFEARTAVLSRTPK
ncbi:zinc ribbon domain-containing protein [Methanoregula formicica]|uniref:zinc ribbon domain-containing protein n=1 Tax=Methanoregula formicica TaxID=882104 RepID=UPI000A03D404